MKKNCYACIITGEEKYIPPSIATSKIEKFGNEEAFRNHYISPLAAKLLRKGQTVDEIRNNLNIQNLPSINPHILTRLNLMRKKKGLRVKETAEKKERERYLNSREYKDKMCRWRDHHQNRNFEEWVRDHTGTGRERGGTCLRPDIFLSHNNRACDGCQCYEFCMCYGKRLSHEKRKPKKQ